ncbi:D-alanyl-D-alanine carboxypeptidase/D-alanyl-D-alanine endopeptidase [Fodinicola acaciae]|uniref:D-alanyl-D-alanine carboxypeptidase/D-alanyl-D-alanine endopeptidase n=1 Tax=Fodinicola acaciae TaxID=2681555 RepID=UPI0013D5E87D|nr:D-alanyl-D-alanine carboxypeptidase/D-alanyl-D-alanine-endopeptidase [Fodinicola acaciae]
MTYRRTAGALLSLLALGALSATLVSTPSDAAIPRAVAHQDPTLPADLDKILADPRLANAVYGVDVRVAATATSLYAHTVDAAVTPASNTKLFTTLTALDLLGPDHRFQTTVGATGPLGGSTLRGDLVLKGTGDPTVRAAEYDALAAKIAANGVRTVTGRLLADDTYFDSQRWNPRWDPTDAPFAYASQISALTLAVDDVYDTGAVQVTTTPTTQGQPAAVALSPATGYVTVDNRATTGAAGSANTLTVDRPAGANKVVVTGSIPAGGAAVVKLRTVEDPALYAASVFRVALAKHGVTVAGATAHGTLPAGAPTLAARQSAPLSAILTPFLKLSNNGIADILAKSIGKKVTGVGSWSAGLGIVKAHVRASGIDTSAMRLFDGSGLSFDDHTSARSVADLLSVVRKRRWFTTFYDALPIAGKPGQLVGGTLETRMVGTPAAGNVHAKTGTLTGATALSGYATAPDGTPLVFAIIMNKYATPTPTDLQNRIAIRLAGGPGSTPAAAKIAPQRHAAGHKELEPSWQRWR